MDDLEMVVALAVSAVIIVIVLYFRSAHLSVADRENKKHERMQEKIDKVRKNKK